MNFYTMTRRIFFNINYKYLFYLKKTFNIRKNSD